MKNYIQLLSFVLATGAAGVAGFFLANSAFVASLPGDVILGAGASLALLGFATYDYSRRYLPLTVRTRVLRPGLPAATPDRAAAGDRRAA
jgi:hypothetical protein